MLKMKKIQRLRFRGRQMNLMVPLFAVQRNNIIHKLCARTNLLIIVSGRKHVTITCHCFILINLLVIHANHTVLSTCVLFPCPIWVLLSCKHIYCPVQFLGDDKFPNGQELLMCPCKNFLCLDPIRDLARHEIYIPSLIQDPP